MTHMRFGGSEAIGGRRATCRSASDGSATAIGPTHKRCTHGNICADSDLRLWTQLERAHAKARITDETMGGRTHWADTTQRDSLPESVRDTP